MALEQKHLWTFEEYTERPEEYTFCELMDGVLFMPPAPMERHQHLAFEIAFALRMYLQQHPVGRVYIPPFDVRLNPAEDKAYHPDVLFVSQERAGIITTKNIQGAPDLVVEVLSQGTAKYDLRDKKSAYEAAGVREYWVVWQDWPRIEVYRLNEAGQYSSPQLLEQGDTLTTTLLPGFSLPLATLYANLPPVE